MSRPPSACAGRSHAGIRADILGSQEFIRGSTTRMDRLINAILKLARESRRTLTPEMLLLAEIVDSIVAAGKTQLTSAGAEIVVEQPLPEMVGDRLVSVGEIVTAWALPTAARRRGVDLINASSRRWPSVSTRGL